MTAVIRASFGAAVAVAFAVVRAPDPRGDAWSHALLLFAALVLMPLALEIFARPDHDDPQPSDSAANMLGRASSIQFPASLLLALACWIPHGWAAALATLPWVVFTGLLAVAGYRRITRGGLRRPLHLLCADLALMFALIGGGWTLSDRIGYQPLGFGRDIVALTAVHFHYAGVLLPLFAGLVQRELWFSRFAARAAVGVVLGVPAVALGITTSQLGWGRAIEAGVGTGLALAGMAVAVLQVRIALEARRPLATRALLALSGAALFFGMVLAGLYAMRAYVAPVPGLDIPQMRLMHGTVNALGFGLCGVLGWRRMVFAQPAAGENPAPDS